MRAASTLAATTPGIPRACLCRVPSQFHSGAGPDFLLHVPLQFHSGAGTVDSADFLPLLRRLDDCIAYVAANPQVSAGDMYILMCQWCHDSINQWLDDGDACVLALHEGETTHSACTSRQPIAFSIEWQCQ